MQLELFDTVINKLKKWIGKNEKVAFWSCIITGLLSHSFMIFNDISVGDDVISLQGLGGTYESGRWVMGMVEDVLERFRAGGIYSVTTFNGLLSILIVAIVAMLIVKIFDIDATISSLCIGSILICFPVITSTFTVMFTSVMYMMSLLFSVVAPYILKKVQGKKAILLSVFSIAISLGIYQAYFSVSVNIFLLLIITDLLNEKYGKLRTYFIEGIKYVGVLISGLILWNLVNKGFLLYKGLEQTGYQGMNEKYDVSKLPEIIKSIYSGFFENILGSPFMKNVICLVIVISIIIAVGLVFFMKKKVLGIATIGLLILMPFTTNLVYALSTSEHYKIHTIMLYSNIFIFVLPILLCEIANKRNILKRGFQLVRGLMCLEIVLIFCVCLIYTYTNNVAYLNLFMIREHSVYNYGQMITLAQACPGYEEDMNIVFVNRYEYENNYQVDARESFGHIMYVNFNLYPLKTHAFKDYLEFYLGMDPEKIILDDGYYGSLDEVQNMPVYPTYGSIRIINENVIIKLGE